MKLFRYVLLPLITLFSIANTNLVGNFSILDLLILVFIIVSYTTSKIVLSKNTLIFVVISNVVIFISLPILIFSTNLTESVLFIGQVWFIIVVLPIFFDILKFHKLILIFSKYYLIVFLIISSLFFIFGVYYFYCIYFNLYENLITQIWVFHLSGLHRINFGDTLVSNDLGVFLAIGLYLIITWVSKKRIQLFLLAFVSITYFLTLSKTIFLILIIFWMYHLRKYFLRGIIFFSIFIILTFPIFSNLPNIERLFNYSEGERGRISKIFEASSKPLVLIVPLYGQMENEIVKFKSGVNAIHNAVLNILVNLGLIPTILLFIPLFYILYKIFNRKVKHIYYKYALLAVLMQILVLMLNALMLTRASWVAIYLVVYFYFEIEAKEIKYYISAKLS